MVSPYLSSLFLANLCQPSFCIKPQIPWFRTAPMTGCDEFSPFRRIWLGRYTSKIRIPVTTRHKLAGPALYGLFGLSSGLIVQRDTAAKSHAGVSAAF